MTIRATITAIVAATAEAASLCRATRPRMVGGSLPLGAAVEARVLKTTTP